MSKTTKPAQKPTKGEAKIQASLEIGDIGTIRQEFYLAVLNMSWQLAIAVLVPLLGGHFIDDHFHTFPLWTVIGFLIALFSMAIIVWQQLIKFSPKIDTTAKRKGQHS